MKKRINISTFEDLQKRGFFSQKQEENDSSPDNQNIHPPVHISTPAINVDKIIEELNVLNDKCIQQIDPSRQGQDQQEDSLVINNLQPSNVVQDRARLPRPNIFCSCKKSFCLKSYCECLKAGQICGNNCNCLNCCNDELRQQAREQRVGCNCKKNHCMTNYCSCKKANNICSQMCQCKSCYNDGEQVDIPLPQAN